MSGLTPKWSIPYSAGSDQGLTIDNTDLAKATLLDGLLTPYDAGARSSRAQSTPGTPGKAGRTYRSADGGVDLDYGTGWITVTPGLFAALPTLSGHAGDGLDVGMGILYQTSAMATAGAPPLLLRWDGGAWTYLSGDPLTGTPNRGKCIIPGSETRSSAAYGTLTTPDQVQNIVLPTDGLIFTAYQAVWSESVNAAARAGIFLNSNQIQQQSAVAANLITFGGEGTIGAGSANRTMPLATWWAGLGSLNAATAVAGSTGADTTNGQAIGGAASGTSVYTTMGGPCVIFAAAGTYTVSVRFKASSGTVTVGGRKLWVWTETGF